MKIKGLTALALLASVGLVAAPMTASAALTEYECLDTADSGSGGANASSSISANTTIGISDCGPYGGNNSEAAVAGLYGEDWNLLDNWDVPEDGSSSPSSENGVFTAFTGQGTSSGTFSFSDVGSSAYLIVLKFDGVFSGFLTNVAANGWGWNTDTDEDEKFDNSHISLYGTGESTTVPTPLPLALIGIGLVGLFAAARRRS
jgi:hypothetical protein